MTCGNEMEHIPDEVGILLWVFQAVLTCFFFLSCFFVFSTSPPPHIQYAVVCIQVKGYSFSICTSYARTIFSILPRSIWNWHPRNRGSHRNQTENPSHPCQSLATHTKPHLSCWQEAILYPCSPMVDEVFGLSACSGFITQVYCAIYHTSILCDSMVIGLVSLVTWLVPPIRG